MLLFIWQRQGKWNDWTPGLEAIESDENLHQGPSNTHLYKKTQRTITAQRVRKCPQHNWELAIPIHPVCNCKFNSTSDHSGANSLNYKYIQKVKPIRTSQCLFCCHYGHPQILACDGLKLQNCWNSTVYIARMAVADLIYWKRKLLNPDQNSRQIRQIRQISLFRSITDRKRETQRCITAMRQMEHVLR